MNIQEELFALRDIEYAAFQAKLTPGIDPDTIIGVRIPALRKLAKELTASLSKEEKKVFPQGTEFEGFLNDLPHKYYDENLLHGMFIAQIKDYDKCVEEVEKFLPFIDNWAVSDTMSPKALAKNKKDLIAKVVEWSASEHTYTCRYGLLTLMRYYLDEDFKDEYLEIPAHIISDEYYVNMMIAWFFATALAKQWNATLPYISEHRLPQWVHRKTIQKAVESYRITDEQKQLLKSYR